jgi:tetratricopeptide (TPR) repeat protein
VHERAIVAVPMRFVPQLRPAIVALAFVVVAAGAAGFIPLFDGPGYESALAAGLILPFAVAVATALDVSAAQAQPIASLGRGLSIGGALAFAAWITTLAHGLRTGFCDALGGSAHFALGPAAGALLAGAWGAVAGEIARSRERRRLAAVVLAVLGPLASILISVGRFYTSPMIFAYDPFVGYFSGTLYDTVIDFSGLLSYRAGSAATLVFALALALHLARGADGRLGIRRPAHPAITLALALGLAGSLGVTLEGPRLGHWQTSATIAAALGARTAGARCDVVYPRSMRAEDAERLARDCDAHVETIERWFGAPYLDGGKPGRITAFVFESASQKGALMGAADTFIAKPWRREVYVQAAGYPHPVLGHELVHAVSNAFGRGPFRIAGSLGGLLPDPGLIEGVAVAGSPPEGDLSGREWAKAMKDLGILPPLDHLFTLGFLGENAGVAYTVSGAFVGWVHERYGGAAIRAWYGGQALAAVTGVPWAELERAWHEDLDRIALPDAARAQAKARFDRPAIFGRRCPHVVDACKRRASLLRGAGDQEGAIEAFEQVLALDPHDDATRVGIARTLLRDGKVDEGTRALEKLASDPAVARHLRDQAIEDLGDLALAAGRSEEAAARYREVMTRTVDEDQLRTLDVKIAAAGDARIQPAVAALLVGKPSRGPDRTLALELLGGVSAALPGDALPWYLLARQYMNAGQYDEARERLDRALAAPSGEGIHRVRVEAERLRFVIACALGDRAGAPGFFAAYASHPEVGEARREAARDLLERCTMPVDGSAGR